MAGLQEFEQVRADALPMGLRQRLALGCELVHRSQVLFLDESTTGLDRAGVAQLLGAVREEVRDGALAVVIAHDPQLAAELEAGVVRLAAGRLVEPS